MRTLGKQIIVSRGEVFTMAREIVRQDGSPYVLRSQLENPYLLIAVSSNTYKLEGKYLKNYWLDLSSYPKFEQSTIKDITQEQLSGNTLPDSFTAETCIYRYLSPSGNKEYYRYIGTSPRGAYVPYSFSFVKIFLNVDTREWIESNYQYEIRILSGETTRTYLTNTFKTLFPDEEVPDTSQEMYDRINEVRPDLLSYVSVAAPLANYATNDIIVPPSVLTVKANV